MVVAMPPCRASAMVEGEVGMISAIFALAGTLIGLLGTVAVELFRGRTDDTRSRRDALRLACADFTADVARMKNLSIELMNDPADKAILNAMRESHREARVHYERLRLITASQSAQEAGRYLVRYAYGLLRQAEGKTPREDERE
jgi:hypothetical protein